MCCGLARAALRHRAWTSNEHPDGRWGVPPWIQSRRPINRSNSLSGDELARDPVQHVEVTVLVHLHDDLPVASLDLDIGKRQMLDGVKVPLVARSALEVPFQLAAVDIDGKDGCDVEIVEGQLSLPLP